MNRREMLLQMGALLVLGRSQWAWSAVASRKPRRLLFFTKSSGFEHGVVRRKGGQLAHAERVMVALGKKHGIEVICSKDGRIFDGDLSGYDGFMFYTSGVLTKAGRDKQPPMSPKGKQALLDAVRAGKGFVGVHSASDSFHTPGDRLKNQPKPDPYLAMLGGEFIRHGPQQKAKLRIVDRKFPGCEKLGAELELVEEWYTFKNFAPDLHVTMVLETKGMRGNDYQRPPFPFTWARRHGKGRVFYTGFGHREDIWTNPLVQGIILGGLRWSFGDVDADLTPNLKQVAPRAYELQPR